MHHEFNTLLSGMHWSMAFEVVVLGLVALMWIIQIIRSKAKYNEDNFACRGSIGWLLLASAFMGIAVFYLREIFIVGLFFMLAHLVHKEEISDNTMRFRSLFRGTRTIDISQITDVFIVCHRCHHGGTTNESILSNNKTKLRTVPNIILNPFHDLMLERLYKEEHITIGGAKWNGADVGRFHKLSTKDKQEAAKL